MINKFHKEHIASILNRVISSLLFLGTLLYFFIKILSYDVSLNSRFLYFQLPFITLIIVFIILYLIHLIGQYFFTHILITDTFIQVKHNFLIKRESTIPFKNVHLYTTQQSILLKPYRAKRVIITSGNRNSKARIDIIIKEELAFIIEDSISAFYCSKVEKEPEIYNMRNKWLLFYSLLMPTKWLRPFSYTLSVLTLIVAPFFHINAVLFIYSIALLASIGISIVYSILKYYNFTIKSMNDCILNISYGKILHIKHFICMECINALYIKHDLINQWTRTCRPYLFVTGYKSNTQNTLPFLPIIKITDLPSILKGFLKDITLPKLESSPPKSAKISYHLPYSIPINIIIIPLLILFIIRREFIAIPIFLFVNAILLLNSFLAFNNTSYSSNEKLIYAKRGGILSAAIVCKKANIQAIYYKNTLFNQKKHIHKTSFFIKSLKKKAFSIGYMRKSDML